ncbi:hypothetical protein KQ3_04920 [Bacillus cereus B5-2]|nr:hypothetical protein KQ3_04920 [Bacillus cereus B5-2]
MFHGKFAYCKSEIRTISYEEIEHFRPKGAIRIKAKENLKYPSYYWLAMKWDNLLVSCSKCNKSKGNFFPLVNENTRATNPNQIPQEAPLLINPCEEDPGLHIAFTKEDCIQYKTDKGNLSIRHYDLYRMELTKLQERLAKDILLKERKILTGLKKYVF